MARATSKQRRQWRVRKVLKKTAEKSLRPRLSVHRTGQHIYAQVIDDAKGATLASASTLDADLKKSIKGPNKDVVFGTDVGAAGSGTGVTFTVTGEDFNFLFHALQTEGRLEVLSRPSILVRDNQEATFTVGERVPTVQDIVVSAAGVVTPSVTYEEVGVILGVTPIINPDGFVNMDIKPEISAIGTTGGAETRESRRA